MGTDSPRRLARVTWANAVVVVVSGLILLQFATSDFPWQLRAFDTILASSVAVVAYRSAKAR